MKLSAPKYVRKTLFIQLVAYFILTIAITLSASSYFTYSYFSSIFKSEITDVNNKLLNQVSIFSDEFILRNLNEVALNIITDNARYSDIALLFSELPERKTDIILNAQNKLNGIVFSNREFVDSIFIHSKKNNVLVSSAFMKYIDEKSAAGLNEFSWVNEFYNANRSILWLKTRNARIYSDAYRDRGDIITVICSYPLSSIGGDMEGCIAINIKEEALNQYLIRFNSTKFSELIVIDNTGTIISHSEKKNLYMDISREPFVKKILNSNNNKDFISTFNENEQVVSFVRSKYNNWYYVSLVPTQKFYEKDILLRQKILVISVVILIIVFIFSNIFSFKIYLPFRKLIDKHILSTGSNNAIPKNVSECKLLDNMFDNMSIKINSLQETLFRNSLMIRHNFLNELLNNRINQSEIENLLKLSNIRFSKAGYCTVIFTMNKLIIDLHQKENIQYYKYSIIDFINSLTNVDCYYCPVETTNTTISTIINFDMHNSDSINSFINEVQTFCFNSFKFYLTAGVGRFVEELAHINMSYVDALVCLKYSFIYPHKNTFCFDGNIQANMNEVALSCDFNAKLEKCLRLSSHSEVKKVLDDFLSVVIDKNVPYRQVRKLMSQFITVYRQYLSDMNINFDDVADESLKKDLTFPTSIYGFIGTFLKMTQISFDFIASKKSSKNSELIEAVKQYVINSLHLDVSLNMAADAIHISTYYLSKIFKEETGINFIDFVARCKIEKAKELLCTTNLNIEEITNRTGFNNITYFSRKFKELTGKPPSLYRNEMIIRSQKTI